MSNLSIRFILGTSSDSSGFSSDSTFLATIEPRYSSVRMSWLSSIHISKSVILKCSELSGLDDQLRQLLVRFDINDDSLSLEHGVRLNCWGNTCVYCDNFCSTLPRISFSIRMVIVLFCSGDSPPRLSRWFDKSVAIGDSWVGVSKRLYESMMFGLWFSSSYSSRNC